MFVRAHVFLICSSYQCEPVGSQPEAVVFTKTFFPWLVLNSNFFPSLVRLLEDQPLSPCFAFGSNTCLQWESGSKYWALSLLPSFFFWILA